MRFNHQQKGFGLVEIMVALLVIAVGVTGLLSLQTYTLQKAKEAEYYNRANFLAKDIFERMRANFNGLDTGTADTPYTLDGFTLVTDSDGNEVLPSLSAPTKNCSDASERCTGEELAKWDLFHWCDNLRKAFGVVAENAPASCPEFPANIVTTPNSSVVNRVRFERYSVLVSIRVPTTDIDINDASNSSVGNLTFQFASEI